MSERSVARYMPRFPEWCHVFADIPENHVPYTCALDLFTVFTGAFKRLYGIMIVDHKRRRILFTNATYFLMSEWVIQQLCNAFPGECKYRHIILDNDKKFVLDFNETATDLFSIKAKHTSPRSPWQNGICERLIGTLR